jgi:hypothetical protein
MFFNWRAVQLNTITSQAKSPDLLFSNSGELGVTFFYQIIFYKQFQPGYLYAFHLIPEDHQQALALRR